MKQCGLLGEKLGHSFSPEIHALLGDYAYRLYEKTPAELGDFLRSGTFDGLNVTIPYKREVIPYCAALSPRAEAIGSVNTLVRRPDGTLYGDNTDYGGFAAMLKASGLRVEGEKALVLGSGGASRTVQAVLRDAGADVVVISRSGPDNYENLGMHSDAAVLVNATPVGMYPHNGASPVDLAAFPRCRGVFDLIYNPARTTLLLQAEERGIAAVGGLRMLVEQARLAAELFCGRDIDPGETDRLTALLDKRKKNIALIGMPGCGKTSVGQALAELLGRPFIDIDQAVEARAGRSIAGLFASEGENAFRYLETQVLDEAAKQSGAVIATGGGVVTRKENRPLLRQNSVVVWLTRQRQDLPTEGRPLSQSRPLAELERERTPLYRAWSDLRIANCGVMQAAEQIQKELKL